MVSPLPKSFKKLKAKNFIWWLIAGAGILLILLGAYFDYQRKVLSFYVTPVVINSPESQLAKPVKIKIADVNIDLEVKEGKISNGIWEISDDSASFLNTSARPGGSSNIVIYGHNKREIFGNLIGRAKVNQEIEITTEDEKVHRYIISEIKTVNPDAISEVLPTDHEVLTVYTCKGLLNSDRLVLKATPVSD